MSIVERAGFDKRYVQVKLPGSITTKLSREVVAEWAQEAGGELGTVGECFGCECGNCYGNDGEPAWCGYVTVPIGASIDMHAMELHVALLLSQWASERGMAAASASRPRHDELVAADRR